MKKKIIAVFKYLVFLFIGLFLLWLVFRKLDLHLVIRQILDANYWWILLSFVFGIISHIARAIRWNILINSLGYKTKTSTTFYAVMIGYFANMALPRLGEITRCGVLSKTDKIPFDSLFGTVVAERVFDLIILIILIIGVIVFQLKLVGGFVDDRIFTPLLAKFSNNVMPILLILFIFLLLLIIIFFLFRYFKPRLKEKSFYSKIAEFINGFFEGLKTILKLKNKSGFLFYTFVIWFMYFLMTYVVFNSMPETSHLTVIDGITVLAIGSLGMVAPVPGGIGAYHFFVKAILYELYDVPSTAAASWATLIHTTQAIMLIVVGVFSYIMIFLQRKKAEHVKT
ncbi:MAG: flippase-like domain-containing protein [Bacteroidales bacterium]|nr:flippase-like domain-containing protein [Bacteroidales bacterium]